MMTENVDEEGQYVNKSHMSNQLRTNQIRTKKSSLPQDREQLYAENIELKSKVRQLTELNLKLRTQLSINQKEKVNLCNIAEEEMFHPKLGNRSHTGHKKSVTNIIANQQNGQSLFNNPLQKEKQSIAFKKIVRDQNIEMQKLNNEIQRLKKTMKYTRMNEILAQNSQLLNQTLRLKDIIAEIRQSQNRVYSDFANEVENLRKKLNNEKDSEKRNGFQLKKQIEINIQLKDKLNQMESKKIDLEKRLNKEIKQYRNEITELKTKLLQYVPFKGRECEKDQCVRNRKEKVQLKKKNQNYQKQVKRLQIELQQKLKLLHSKDSQNKKLQESNFILKTPENKEKSNSHVKKDESKNIQMQSKHTQKDQQKVFLEQQSKKKEKIESNIINKIDQKVQNPSHKQKPQSQEKKVLAIAKEPEAKEKEGEKRKTKKKSDSIDTQKLLKSQQSQEESKQIQSASLRRQAKEKQKDKSSQHKQKQYKITQQVKNKLAQSDGQYENLDYDQFQDEQVQNEKEKKGKLKEQEKKKKIQKKQKNTIEDQKAKKQVKKSKQKSAKKLQKPAKSKDDEEQILYSGEKQKEAKQSQGDKQELKLLRDTLIYKFMAQNYSFQNFCNDINSSDMKEFSITDIMNLLSGQPFLLHDEQIQLVIIYLFDTNEPTGEQSLTTKEFIKKMKKFIGKAKAIKEEQQSSNIQLLSEIIIRDEQGEKKMRKKWTEMDSGDGSITVEQFKKVMSLFKVKESLLQTAISQIAYVSQDLNHLNYDFFLKRFLQTEN